MKERTIARTVTLEGIGLHTGKQATMRLNEGSPGSGILFKRVDLPGNPVIAAQVDNVINVDRCTVLGKGGARVSTVEHFMAAAYGLGLDNLLIEINGEEVPAMDGSAKVFCSVLQEAGYREQEEERRSHELDAPLWVEHEGALNIALPSEVLKLTCIIDFSHPLVGTQICELIVSSSSVLSDIAPARTFGFMEEVIGLRERELALGGDFENALVISPDGFSSPLRFENEPVRHKCLDLLGDLALTGARIPLHVISIRGGHSLNIRLVRAICNQIKEKGTAPVL